MFDFYAGLNGIIRFSMVFGVDRSIVNLLLVYLGIPLYYLVDQTFNLRHAVLQIKGRKSIEICNYVS